jgi:hypothetical protein
MQSIGAPHRPRASRHSAKTGHVADRSPAKKSRPFNRSIQYYFRHAFTQKIHALKACAAVARRRIMVHPNGAWADEMDRQTTAQGQGHGAN